MPPHQQHPILLIENDSDCGPIQMHNVMLEPLPAWDLHIGQPQPDPPVVIDQPFPMHNPACQLSIIIHTVKLPPYSYPVYSFQPDTVITPCPALGSSEVAGN